MIQREEYAGWDVMSLVVCARIEPLYLLSGAFAQTRLLTINPEELYESVYEITEEYLRGREEPKSAYEQILDGSVLFTAREALKRAGKAPNEPVAKEFVIRPDPDTLCEIRLRTSRVNVKLATGSDTWLLGVAIRMAVDVEQRELVYRALGYPPN